MNAALAVPNQQVYVDVFALVAFTSSFFQPEDKSDACKETLRTSSTNWEAYSPWRRLWNNEKWKEFSKYKATQDKVKGYTYVGTSQSCSFYFGKTQLQRMQQTIQYGCHMVPRALREWWRQRNVWGQIGFLFLLWNSNVKATKIALIIKKNGKRKGRKKRETTFCCGERCRLVSAVAPLATSCWRPGARAACLHEDTSAASNPFDGTPD